MANLGQLVNNHFSTLPDKHALDFEDGYSKILEPRRVSGTVTHYIFDILAKILVRNKSAKWRHINYFTFKRLFDEISKNIGTPLILETGSSAHGTNSSMLFASLAEITGGRFDTVDINSETVAKVHNSILSKYGNTGRHHCHLGDSVEFIKNFNNITNVVYLDSFDLDIGHFDESAAHGLKEFEFLIPKLADVSFILIDDTPATRQIFEKMNSPRSKFLMQVDAHLKAKNRLPGKGELILERIRNDNRFIVLDHQYQLLLRFDK